MSVGDKMSVKVHREVTPSHLHSQNSEDVVTDDTGDSGPVRRETDSGSETREDGDTGSITTGGNGEDSKLSVYTLPLGVSLLLSSGEGHTLDGDNRWWDVDNRSDKDDGDTSNTRNRHRHCTRSDSYADTGSQGSDKGSGGRTNWDEGRGQVTWSGNTGGDRVGINKDR